MILYITDVLDCCFTSIISLLYFFFLARGRLNYDTENINRYMGNTLENPPLLQPQKSSVGVKRHHVDSMLNPGGGAEKTLPFKGI